MARRIPELLADYIGPDTIAFVEWPRDAEAERGAALRASPLA